MTILSTEKYISSYCWSNGTYFKMVPTFNQWFSIGLTEYVFQHKNMFNDELKQPAGGDAREGTISIKAAF